MDIHDNSGSKIEDLLHEIIIRLDKIERQVDGAFYPDESFFRQDYISYIQKQKNYLMREMGFFIPIRMNF